MHEDFPMRCAFPVKASIVHTYGTDQTKNVDRTVLTSSRTGVDLPNWRVLIAKGEDATTAFNGVKFDIYRWQDGHAHGWYVDPPGPFHDYLGSTLDGMLDCQTLTFLDAASQVTALNQAKRAFINKAKNIITPLQMGVVMGELMETLHMIRHPLLGFRRGLGGYLRKAKKLTRTLPARRIPRALSDAYLEATFGWQPFVADIEGGLDALRLYFYHRPFEIKRFYGGGKDEVISRSTGNVYSGSGVAVSNLRLRSSWELSDTYSVRLRGGIKLRSEGSETPVNKLTGLLGLRLRDFAPTAWELLPYSFLIDYFTNVGSIIDACSYVQGNVAWICQTTRRIQDRILTDQRWDPTDGHPYHELSPTHLFLRKKTVTRGGLSSIVPDFQVQLPGLGTRHALNIAGLIAGRL